MPGLNTVDSQLADDIGGFFADPLGYVLYAFDWGQGELEGSDGPDAWQRDLLADLGRGVIEAEAALRFAVASGHGIGKSALVAWVILWAMSTRPHLAGVVTANTGTQLSTKTWRELSLWQKRAINGHWFEWTATGLAQRQHPETWRSSAIPWSKERPEAFAGLHAVHVLVVFDEASAVDDVIWETTEGAMTTPGAIWLAFGNPTRNTGRFRECWGRFRHRWNTRQVDSRTAKMANRAQLDQWVADYGLDSDFVRVRVLGQFPKTASMQFIGQDLVDAATVAEALSSPADPLLVGVDVARFGDDASVIAFRRGRDGRTFPAIKRRQIDTVDLAGLVAEIARGSMHTGGLVPDVVFVDGGGVGGGVVDQLRRLNVAVVEVNSASRSDDPAYGNLRAAMWKRMRDWLKAGGAIAADQELAADLVGVEYGFGARDLLFLERKEDMKRRGLASPDNADALALTFAYPAGPRGGGHRSAHQSRAGAGWDYDPLEAA